MTITWLESMATGIAEVDEDHRRVIETLGDLLGAVEAEAWAAASDLMATLETVTSGHFALEEYWMAWYHYPKANEHQQRHLNALASIRAIAEGVAACDAAATTRAFDRFTHEYLKMLFVDDLAFASFLEFNGIREAMLPPRPVPAPVTDITQVNSSGS